MNLKFDREKVQGEIIVPENMQSTFYWKGKTDFLEPGVNKIGE